jgi:predicted Zn finger-like uncharacterized protein
LLDRGNSGCNPFRAGLSIHFFKGTMMSTLHDVLCPGCNHRYRIQDEHLGRTVKCKQCSLVFTISPPATPQPEPETARKPSLDPTMDIMKIVAGILWPSGAMWLTLALYGLFLLTIGVAPSFNVIIHEWSLFWAVMLTIVIAYHFLRNLLPRFRGRGAVVAGVAFFGASLASWTWGLFDNYEQSWTRGKVEYRDSYRRKGPKLFYRKIYVPDDYAAEGAMSGEPTKPHGHWVTRFFKPAETVHQWYWYGTEINQGEWELRQRK